MIRPGGSKRGTEWQDRERANAMNANARANLIKDVFLRCQDARLEFNSAVERCALKGWPDRSEAVRTAAKLQELFIAQLSARLTHLVSRAGSGDIWNEYTTTAQVQGRVQEGWTEGEEQALRSYDAAYSQIQPKIDELQAIADSEAVEEPFEMAKRDRELIAAGWKLNNTVYALDQELAL
jgi:hypothetical protein